MNHPTISSNTKTAPAIFEDAPLEFTSVLAHEIRNPLANINLSVELLGSEIKDNDLKMYLDIIRRSSVRINNLIIELLRQGQAEELQAEKHSICQLLDEVLGMAEDRIRLKKIMVSKEYVLQDCNLFLNGQKIKIALTNIIVNAIDAMTPATGRLTLVTKSIGDKYILQIGDNGCGISQENLKHIFKPYFTNRPGGLGLGLTTACYILQVNNVGLKVESEEGKGTCFFLLFNKDLPL